MTPADRGRFVAAYSRLITDVWTEPDKERQLAADPRALLASYGLDVGDGVRVTVVRDVADAEPDLNEQVSRWAAAPETGELVMVVPALDVAGPAELAEDELDSVVGGLDSSCACCCPCCCTS